MNWPPLAACTVTGVIQYVDRGEIPDVLDPQTVMTATINGRTFPSDPPSPPGLPGNNPIASHPMFKIETLTPNGWTDDASLLGFGASQEDNRWPTQDAALAACAELCAVMDPTRLRVVPT